MQSQIQARFFIAVGCSHQASSCCCINCGHWMTQMFRQDYDVQMKRLRDSNSLLEATRTSCWKRRISQCAFTCMHAYALRLHVRFSGMLHGQNAPHQRPISSRKRRKEHTGRVEQIRIHCHRPGIGDLMALDVKLGSEVPLLQEQRPVEFVALQPVAIVDHVCSVDEGTLKSIVGAEEIGGSRRVEQEEIQQLLGGFRQTHISSFNRVSCFTLLQLFHFASSSLTLFCRSWICTFLLTSDPNSLPAAAAVGDFTTKAGGSAANTSKGGVPPPADCACHSPCFHHDLETNYCSGLASGWGVQCQLVSQFVTWSASI